VAGAGAHQDGFALPPRSRQTARSPQPGHGRGLDEGIYGKLDDQAPVEDIYLLMEHGRPKEARGFPKGGHMGRTPGMDAAVITGVITSWLKERLT